MSDRALTPRQIMPATFAGLTHAIKTGDEISTCRTSYPERVCICGEYEIAWMQDGRRVHEYADERGACRDCGYPLAHPAHVARRW